MEYDCSYYSCSWDQFKKDEDWGFYSKNSNTAGECNKCKEMCSSDPNCGSVECGSSYCSWWRNGKCALFESSQYSTKTLTCRKRSKGNDK